MNKFFSKLDDIIVKVGNWGLVTGGVLILLMSFLTVYAVGRRYLLNNPEPYSYEISTMFLTACVVFAIPGLQWARRHLRVDFIANYFSARVQLIFTDIVCPVLGLLFVAIVTWKSLENALYSLSIWETSTSAWQEPLWPTKMLIPVSMFWLCLVLLSQIIHAIVSLVKGSYRPAPDTENVNSQ